MCVRGRGGVPETCTVEDRESTNNGEERKTSVESGATKPDGRGRSDSV